MSRGKENTPVLTPLVPVYLTEAHRDSFSLQFLIYRHHTNYLQVEVAQSRNH